MIIDDAGAGALIASILKKALDDYANGLEKITKAIETSYNRLRPEKSRHGRVLARKIYINRTRLSGRCRRTHHPAMEAADGLLCGNRAPVFVKCTTMSVLRKRQSSRLQM